MSEETDSDNSENVEPIFKYVRIANCLESILNNDFVTCVAIHEKFIAFGTNYGLVHLLDHHGNAVKNEEGKIKEISHHAVAVNQICIDKKGEYVASCSDDGKIFITSLFGSEFNQKLYLNKSVKCIALDLETKYSSAKRFIVGDDNLTLYEKNFLNNMKPIVLCKTNGFVSAISWNNQFVAWASNSEVHVYDLNEKCSLGVMEWEESGNYTLKNSRCNLRWSNSTTLLIGWENTIRVCVIRKRNSIDASTRFYPGYIVDPISTFRTPFLISGLAPFGPNQLVLLGYPKESSENGLAVRPVLCVITHTSKDYEKFTMDSLSLRGFEKYKVNDYFLEYIEKEHRYFIVTPKDTVVAILHNNDDKIQWLIEHKKFERALEVINTNNVETSYLSVAKLYIDHLLSLKQYTAAANICKDTLGKDKELWKEEVYKFVKHEELRSISAYLPCSSENKLDPQVYEMVLFEYLKRDSKGFLNLVKLWQPDLYDIEAVIKAVIKENVTKENANELPEALAILYTYQKNYNCALQIYLNIKNKEIFNLINTHGLYSSINEIIIPLLELDNNKAIDIFVSNNMSSDIIFAELNQREDLLFQYLKGLDKKNKGKKYHEKLVDLYTKFEPTGLLPFLKRSDSYPIQQALDICRSKSFFEEMVYLLERMGNSSEALNIIVKELKDIEKAIDFCKRLGDSDLWNDLIEESLKNSKMISKLLNNIAGYINPQIVVEKIKPEENIDDLKNSLIKMLRDYSLHMSIQESYNKIVVTDYFNSHEKLVQNNCRAICVDYDNKCSGSRCKGQIVQKDIIIVSA